MILEAAIKIGDRLLQSAEHSQDGTFWKTAGMDADGNAITQISEDVYGGVSGIVIFLIELYQHTANSSYLDAAQAAAQFLLNYCRKHPSQNIAFLTGRMSVPFALLRVSKISGDETYLKNAVEIAKSLAPSLNDPDCDEYLNGTAGALLALAHLHAATGEDWIVQVIDAALKQMLRRANHEPGGGIFWDLSPRQIRGLCGFSHGASGVGFVFLELGHYFQNESLFKVAKQLFQYEAAFLNEVQKNWPDFRKGIWSEEDYRTAENAYRNCDWSYFTTPQYVNLWCHGAAGIGLTRLRAYELLGNSVYEREALLALEKSTEDLEKPSTFTLCHGRGGYAELFLEAYRVFKDEKYLQSAHAIASQSSVSGYHDKDLTLFNGISGIGYFLLRVLDPMKTPSILAPRIDAQSDKINQIYDVERQRTPVMNSVQSYALLYIKNEVEKKVGAELLLMAHDLFEQQTLVLDPDCKIVRAEGSQAVLLIPDYGPPQEILLSPLSENVLSCFLTPTKVNDALHAIKADRNAVLETIQNAVSSAILIKKQKG